MKNYTLKTVLCAAFLVVPSCVVFVGLIFFSRLILWKPSGNNSPVNSSTVEQTTRTPREVNVTASEAEDKVKKIVDGLSYSHLTVGDIDVSHTNDAYDEYLVTVKMSYWDKDEYGLTIGVKQTVVYAVDKESGELWVKSIIR